MDYSRLVHAGEGGDNEKKKTCRPAGDGGWVERVVEASVRDG